MDAFNRNSVYYAASNGHYDILKVLLETNEGKKMTAEYDRDYFYPLHKAAENGHIEVVKLLMENKASAICTTDLQLRPIHLAAKNNHADVVELFVSYNRNLLIIKTISGDTPLHVACTYNSGKTLKRLIQLGASIEIKNESFWTPLILAAKNNAKDCVKILLQNQVIVDAIDKEDNSQTALIYAANHGHHDIVKLLIENGADVSLNDASYMNALCYAIMEDKRECVSEILSSKDWKKAMRAASTIQVKGYKVPQTPFRLMIKYCPDMAEKVLQACTYSKLIKEPEEDVEFMFDYEFIDDAFNFSRRELWKSHFFQKRKKKNLFFYTYNTLVDEDDNIITSEDEYHWNSRILMENHPLMIMVDEGRLDLLTHPLSLSLLELKWRKFGRYVYYPHLAIYGLFLAFLTSYILTGTNTLTLNTLNITENCMTNITENITNSDFHTWSMIGTIALSILRLIFEIIQMIRLQKHYFTWKNLIDWLTYASSLILAINIDFGPFSLGLTQCWHWKLSSFVITIAWLNLLSTVRQSTRLGIYVIMFTDILKTFFQFSIVLIIFLVAFGLGFHILLGSQEPFFTVGQSIIKTTIMMVGEIDFNNIFHGKDFQRIDYNATIILFVGFLILVSILVVNLLVGLAVDNIKGVLEHATLKKIAMQVELVLDVERLVFTSYLRKIKSMSDEYRKLTSWPNDFQKLAKNWIARHNLGRKPEEKLKHEDLQKLVRETVESAMASNKRKSRWKFRNIFSMEKN